MLEWLFSHPISDYRAGELVWVSGWPTWALALAIGAALVLTVVLQLRGTRQLARGWRIAIGALDFAALALVLVLLWRPALGVDRLDSARNVVAVLVDVSRSMALAEGEGGTRLRRAVDAIDPTLLAALRERFELRLYAFAERVEPLTKLDGLEASGAHTRLAPALREVLGTAQTTPLSAVVLVSDGGGQDVAELGALWPDLERSEIPVHTIGVGEDTLAGDVELADVSVPAAALAGSRIDARVTVRHAASGPARLRVTEGDALVAARTIELDPERRTQLESISLPAGSGMRELRFAIEPLANEKLAGNNAQSRVVEVSSRKRRVLYFEGEPRWEYRFIRRALEKDPALELVSMLRTTDRKLYRQGIRSPEELAAGFPSESSALFAYDALVLGSIEAATLSDEQQALIRDFVGVRGGGLLMLGGRKGLADGGWGSSPVQEVLPVRLERGDAPTFVRRVATVQLTRHGETSSVVQLDADPTRNRALWAELPPVGDQQSVGALKPGARSLLDLVSNGKAAPLLTVQRYGRGQAAVLASGGTWRWKMQLQHEDARFNTFWRQLLRSLAESAPDPVNVTAEVTSVGDSLGARVRVELHSPEWKPLDAPRVAVTWVGDGGRARVIDAVRTAETGVYEADLVPESSGLYRVEASADLPDGKVAAAPLHLRVAAERSEDFRPELNRAVLERVASASGGAFWNPSDLKGLPDAIRDSGQGVRRREILELWLVPAAFLLLLLLKGGAWVLRRKAGSV